MTTTTNEDTTTATPTDDEDTPDMTRGELLDVLRKMLYFKLMELHVRLASQDFSNSDSDFGTFTAIRDVLRSLESLGAGNLNKKLYDEEVEDAFKI